MLGGLTAKIGAGIGLALLVAVAWQAHRASAAEQRLEDALVTAAEHRAGWQAALGSATSALAAERAAVERLQGLVAVRDQALALAAERLGQMQTETDAQIRALEEATDDAPVEYQSCIAVPAPAAVGRLLRVDAGPAGAGGRDRDEGRDRDAAPGVDG